MDTQGVRRIGGAARSRVGRRNAPAIFGVPVHVPPRANGASPGGRPPQPPPQGHGLGGRPPGPPEWVALGAARQAAWALSGAADPPDWPLSGASAEYTADPVPLVRRRYAALRDATAGWT